jgi:hypothetical protein
MSKKKNFIFIALHIVAWLIFVGLSIEAGGLLVNFVFSIFKPEMVQLLYQKLDLSGLYVQSQVVFYCTYGLMLSLSILKAYLFYVLIMLMLKLDLEKPFNSFVSGKITFISHITFIIGLLSLIAQQVAENLSRKGFGLNFLNSFGSDYKAFILMAAVIYVIAIIFKKGVEIQNENDLTV